MSGRGLRRLLCSAGAFGLVGCVYFNGMYNAKQQQKRADKAARRGQAGEAGPFYLTAAQKAESVLVHHKKSRWRSDALYIAGRGWALGGQCAKGEPRLIEYLELAGQPAEKRERATLALGSCLVRDSRYLDGRSMLATLVHSHDPWVANEAALWAARASIAVGQQDSVLAYLGMANAVSAEWELIGAYIDQRRYAPAESLLAHRAAEGDRGTDLPSVLTTLWSAGRRDQVERITALYDHSRLSSTDRAKLHLLVGDLWLGADGDSAARWHYLRGERLARDTTLQHEAAARLTLAAIRHLTTMPDVVNAIREGHDDAAGAPLARRTEDQFLLVSMLADRVDFTGASLFLAAEVARDSLQAYGLAHTLFMRVATGNARSPVAPKALLAAAALMPDSATTYRERLVTLYPNSPYALALTRVDSSQRRVFATADDLLSRMWDQSKVCYADSLKILHPPPPLPGTGPAPGAPGSSAALPPNGAAVAGANGPLPGQPDATSQCRYNTAGQVGSARPE